MQMQLQKTEEASPVAVTKEMPLTPSELAAKQKVDNGQSNSYEDLADFILGSCWC